MAYRPVCVPASAITVLTFAAIAVGCGGSTTTVSQRQPAATTTVTPIVKVKAKADPTPKCVPEKLVVAYYLRPDGARSATPSPGAATVLRGDLGGQELLVPKGFNPLTANAYTLYLFGFPPRPHDPAALAQWNAQFRHYRGSAPAGLTSCPGIKNGAFPLHNAP